MDARGRKRIIVSLPAEIICKERHVAGTIENLSEDGIYLVTPPQKNAFDLCPNTILQVRFQLPSGQMSELQCRVIWSFETPPHGFTTSVGMQIIAPPDSYKESLLSLE